MATQANQGKKALEKNDYESAVIHLSAALKTSQAPTWLLHRSAAYHRLGKHELAIADADNALLVALSRGSRELIGEAHHRRGIAYHGLKQYGNARICFHWSRKYIDKSPGLTMWISIVAKDYDANGGDQAECNKITAKEIPDKVEEVSQSTQLTGAAQDNKSDMEAQKKAKDSVIPTPPSKIRHEWYQSQDTVAIEILAKGVPKGSVNVNMQETSLEVSFPAASSQSVYDFTLAPLFSEIDIAKSSYRITPHKIEIILWKAKSGYKWSALEGSESSTISKSSETSHKTTSNLPKQKSQTQTPVYPTSSKTGPKNWDTITGDEPDDDNTDGPDAFFKMLYKSADADTKRAMIKSYQESNGTSLSTQWSDVGSRTVETIPPEGVEAKKWDA